jgi:hypothetical protein
MDLRSRPINSDRSAVNKVSPGEMTFISMLFWLLVSAFLLASCGSSQSSSLPLSAADPTAQSAAAMHPVEALPSTSITAIEIRNGPNPGSLELAARGAVELDPELTVEQRLSDGSFQALQNLDLGSMKLITSCDQQISTCVRVDEHGFRPVAWSGMSCSSQCNHSCDKNVRLFGYYRFVVMSCDGKTRFEGPVFELVKTH